MNPLRALDEQVLPALARGLGRVAGRLGRAGRTVAVRLPASAVAGLDRLDARFARGSALGLVRELPQVGFVLVGALLVGGSFAAIHLDAEHAASAPPGPTAGAGAPPRPAGCPAGAAAGTAYVGPVTGTAPTAYAAQQLQTLTACAHAAPRTHLFAVVSLADSESPAAVAQDLRAVTVLQVFAQLPAEPASPRVLPVTGRQDGTVQREQAIDGAYDVAQAAFLADRADQLTFAGSITARTPTEVAGKADAVAAAGQDALAAAQLRLRCGCVYGAVVVGTVADLAALVTSAVRTVALAPVGTQADGLTGRPLLPSETGALGGTAAPTPVVAGSIR